MLKNIFNTFKLLAILFCTEHVFAQNIFNGEPVQVVGTFNGFVTTPYNTDYRTTAYRKLSTTITNPIDGRGQWKTTINAQTSGGNVTPINMAGGSGNGFLFISGPSTNRFQNKWVFGYIGKAALNSFNDFTSFNSGEDMGLNMSTVGYYTFVMNDNNYNLTNPKFYVGYTSNNPVNVLNNNVLVNANGSAVVNITTCAVIAPEEFVYVRYTTGTDFAGSGTSTIVQATGSGTAFSANIPAQTLGSTIRYFVFTSTVGLAVLSGYSEVEKSISVLNFDDNTGNNYIYTLSTLPIKINIFYGTPKNNSVLLNWKIEPEISIDKYTILRSEDGIVFKEIGFVKAISNNSEYSFTDNNASSKKAFYKLAIAEKSGSIHFSKIILISNSGNGNTLNVYPNPASAFINIDLPFAKKGMYALSIFNVAGKKIINQSYSFTGNEQYISILLNEAFSKGEYFVVIEGENKKHQSRFIIN